MGWLTYDTSRLSEIDDRTLAHLQIVVAAKLRRHESFFFTWDKPLAAGSGRGMAWMHPSSSLLFEFSGNRVPSINRHWVEKMMDLANGPAGLHIIPEPAVPATAAPRSESLAK